MEEAPFNEVSEDEQKMRAKELIDNSKGFIFFSIKQDGNPEWIRWCQNLSFLEEMALLSIAKEDMKIGIKLMMGRTEDKKEEDNDDGT